MHCIEIYYNSALSGHSIYYKSFGLALVEALYLDNKPGYVGVRGY